MSWAALTPTTPDYGAAQRFLSEYLDVYNEMRSTAALSLASGVAEVFLSEAKAEVLRDLQVALNLNPDRAADLEVIDDLCDDGNSWHQSSRLRWAVALKQLEIAYRESRLGVESENADLSALYGRKYAQERKGFAALRQRQGSSGVRVTRVGL